MIFKPGQPVIWTDFDGRTWPARVTAVGPGRVRSQLDGGQPDAGVSRTFTLWERQWQCGCMTMRAIPSDPTYTRDDLIRVVLAQQWAVAIALMSPWNRVRFAYVGGNLADLPCAVDVVDGLG